MATTTPNYGWSVPTSSDLVKNGATDIETLGDSVDASLWNSGYGQAGKNKIMNGDFAINQRNFTSNTTGGTNNFDRWLQVNSGTTGTLTVTPQTFTAGAAPVAGYEAANYVQCVTAAGASVDTLAHYTQRIEDVRLFAGQTATLSFWAKAASGTPKIGIEVVQNFGTGGSPSASVLTSVGTVTISTSWARYNISVAVPSISGKTVGTTANTSYFSLNLWLSAGSNFAARASSIGLQNNTFQIWGVQVEYGSKATPFQTASGGSPQAELAMCQRYYYRIAPGATTKTLGSAFGLSTTVAVSDFQLPQQFRTAPTALEQSGTAADYIVTLGSGSVTCSAVPALGGVTNGSFAAVNFTVASGLVAGQAGRTLTNASGAYLGWSAEL